MRAINVLSLCGGICVGKMALLELDIIHNYYDVEISKSKRLLADINLLGIQRPVDDVREIRARHILYDWCEFDLVLAGPTCKSLSRQSNGKGLDGSSEIFFDVIGIIQWVLRRNPNAKFLIENVASMDLKERKILDKLVGVDSIKIPSALVSGQARDRLYWTNFKVDLPKDRNVYAQSVVEDGGKFVAWSKSTRYILKTESKEKHTKVWSSPAPDRKSYTEERYRTDGKANTLVTGKHCWGQSTKNIIRYASGVERGPSVSECARLQTIPEWFNFGSVSEDKAFEAIGDAWNLEVIKHILTGIRELK